MSWFIPYNQLDNEQINFLSNIGSNYNSNYWLKGYAGSGKSVILIHCLLKEKERNPKSRVIIVLYTHALIDMIKTGIPSQYSNTEVVTYHQFNKMNSTWDLILVDEVQDLPEYIVRDIHSKGKRVIVAGDVNQSIYDNVCESNQITNILSSQSFSLAIIHRISRSIRKLAQFFCSDRNGFNAASLGRLVELPPRLIHADTHHEECNWLLFSTKEYARAGYAPAILIPRHLQIIEFLQTILKLEGKNPIPDEYTGNSRDNYNKINAHFKSVNLKFQYLGNGAGSFDNASRDGLVTVMTYHSAKGLDFKAVFIPFLTTSLEIWRDPESRAKTLFFVALTRSREQLFLSYSGTNKHPYLSMIPDGDFHKLKASDEVKRMNNPLGDNGSNDEPLVVF
jgi:superfamily I DNA/RNA helicase